MNNDLFQLFISGCEPDSYYDIVCKETPTMLMSFLYAQRKGKGFIKKRAKQRPDVRFLIDSGAHTFLSRQDEYVDKPIEYWEKYLEDYTQFARDNKEHIFAIVELDIDDLVGIAQVEEWREKYFEPLEKEGISVCYVWHEVKGLDSWDSMCAKYDYVGFSFQEKQFSPKEINRLFFSAKKYNARVHGFACTGSEAMLTYPFATTDSTVWLVGTQYGEVNYFDGRKMMRLKKDKWKRQFKNKLIQMGANWTLMEHEDPYELQRVNILTLVAIEKYVQKKMRQKMYWVGREKPKLIDDRGVEKMEENNTVENKLPIGTLPEVEWFATEMNDYLLYCDSLGIDKSLIKKEATDYIEAFYHFINRTEAIADYSSEEIYNLVDMFKIKGINTVSKAVIALTEAFKDHAEGKRNDLNKIASAPTSPPRGSERDDMLEENNEIIVDVPIEECESILCKFLPSGGSMPEVDKYDEVLLSANIIPIRDESGKLVKGQKKYHRPKKLYSDLMPKLQCNTCYKAQDCPDYREGCVCRYNKIFKRFNTRNAGDVMDAMHGMVELNLERLQRMVFFELMDGGMADPNVSSLIDQNTRLLNMIQQMSVGAKIVASKRTIIDESGRVEETTTVSSNPQEGGILTKIFGSMNNTRKEADMQTIDVEAKEIRDEE